MKPKIYIETSVISYLTSRPKLVAVYVDKLLQFVLAVQALLMAGRRTGLYRPIH